MNEATVFESVEAIQRKMTDIADGLDGEPDVTQLIKVRDQVRTMVTDLNQIIDYYAREGY